VSKYNRLLGGYGGAKVDVYPAASFLLLGPESTHLK
jgi:hypothetical protein